MFIPEEYSALFRLDDLKALGITGVDLWSLLPEELEGLTNLQQVEGILETVTSLDTQIGEITAQISSEVSKYIGTGLGAIAGVFLPGIGAVLGSIISSFLGGLLGDLFGPDRIPRDKLEDEGLSYHRCIIYIPPGAARKNRHGFHAPEGRGGTVFSQTHDQQEEEFFLFRCLGNVITSKAEPHIPIGRFVKFDKNDKPILSTCIGFTREGYALFDEWPGSQYYIGAEVEKGGIPYQTARNAGIPQWAIEGSQKTALLAKAAGLPGGFNGPPGLEGRVYRFKRRIMATFSAVKEKGVPLKAFIFRWSFWKYIPGFTMARPGGRGSVPDPNTPRYYSWSFFKFKMDLRSYFVTGSSRESPGRIRWISVGVASIASLLLGLFLLRRKR